MLGKPQLSAIGKGLFIPAIKLGGINTNISASDSVGKTTGTGTGMERYDQLLSAIGDARIVLIGEASHGTHEFYRERCLITQRLIQEKGFTGVCVEADFPESNLINWYIKNVTTEPIVNAKEALREFRRFPLWMWRNTVIVEFLEWLKKYNLKVRQERKNHYFDQVSFYGLDLYSLHSSANRVIEYLQDKDPEAAILAKNRYGCFERFGEDTMSYAFASRYGMAPSCEAEAINVLRDLLHKRSEYLKQQYDQFKGPIDEPQFVAEMNARVVKDAEAYYRLMLVEDVVTWNIRDTHFYNVLNQIIQYLSKQRQSPAKVVVWAHNSHIGDARNTEMGWRRGELNLGQLCREKYGQDQVYNIGLLNHSGTVTAAHQWDSPAEKFKINPGRLDSYEGLFHQGMKGDDFLLIFNEIRKSEDDNDDPVMGNSKKCQSKVAANTAKLLNKLNLLERYIGVIYKPETERWSHYSKARIASQYDALIYIDQTHALVPLDKTAHFPDETENTPELFPFGE